MHQKEKIRIRVREIVHDIKSGLSEFDLMTKYGLSSRGLQSAFRKLISAKVITYGQICGISPTYEDTCEVIDDRALSRNYVVFELPVVEVQNSNNRGWARDLTEQGLKTSGLKTTLGSMLTLLIVPEELEDFLPFTLEAKCLWALDDGDQAGQLAGFKIVNISAESLDELRRLIDFMTITF